MRIDAATPATPVADPAHRDRRVMHLLAAVDAQAGKTGEAIAGESALREGYVAAMLGMMSGATGPFALVSRTQSPAGPVYTLAPTGRSMLRRFHAGG